MCHRSNDAHIRRGVDVAKVAIAQQKQAVEAILEGRMNQPYVISRTGMGSVR
jgi:hypothetical protein